MIRFLYIIFSLIIINIAVLNSVMAQSSTPTFKEKMPYFVHAVINEEEKTIDGHVKIIFHNSSADTLYQIPIQTFFNAFASDSSAYVQFMLKQGDLRQYFLPDKERGHIRLSTIKVNKENILFTQDTLSEIQIIPLHKHPIFPQTKAEINILYKIKIPTQRLPIGYDKDSLVLTHFYPEIAFFNEGVFYPQHLIFPFENTLEEKDINIDIEYKNHKIQYHQLTNKSITFLTSSQKPEEALLTHHYQVPVPNNVSVGNDFLEKIFPNKFPNDKTNLQLPLLYYNTKTTSKTVRPTWLFNLKETDKYHYLSMSPAIGYNYYDGIMLGGFLHNHQLPQPKFTFFLSPLYSIKQQALQGVAQIGYRFPIQHFNIETSILLSKFTHNQTSIKSIGDLSYPIKRIVPSITIDFPATDDMQKQWTVQLKNYQLYATSYNLSFNPIPKAEKINKQQNIWQLSAHLQNNRTLYPYNVSLEIFQGKGFVRTDATARYFFNYNASGKGLSARFFAGKFFYTIEKNPSSRYALHNYFLNLSAGINDFTYSDYFIARHAQSDIYAQQINDREGFFKVSMPYRSGPVGFSDNWIMALNLVADFPNNIPVLNIFSRNEWLRLKLFADIGTYAEAWSERPSSGKFLFDAGLQANLFYNSLVIYVPILYSRIYQEYYSSIGDLGSFDKRIKFLINLNTFYNLKKNKNHRCL